MYIESVYEEQQPSAEQTPSLANSFGSPPQKDHNENEIWVENSSDQVKNGTVDEADQKSKFFFATFSLVILVIF